MFIPGRSCRCSSVFHLVIAICTVEIFLLRQHVLQAFDRGEVVASALPVHHASSLPGGGIHFRSVLIPLRSTSERCRERVTTGP